MRAVNSDLKEHISRLENALRLKNHSSNEPRRLIGDLTAKYERATEKFKDYLAEAEESKNQVQNELGDMKRKLRDKIDDNNALRGQIGENEV